MQEWISAWGAGETSALDREKAPDRTDKGFEEGGSLLFRGARGRLRHSADILGVRWKIERSTHR